MQPYYDHDGITIYHGDCLEEMNEISEGCVDFVLTDPPYGTTDCAWDSVIPYGMMWAQLERVTKPNAAIAISGSEPFSSALRMSNIKEYKYDWVWVKPKGTGHLNAKKQPLRDSENIILFYKTQCTYNPQMTQGEPYKNKAGKDHTSKSSMTDGYGDYTNFRNDNEGLRYPRQVLNMPCVERGTVHPTQKPVALMAYLIRTYTNTGETVLDFTMGSGTTLRAAKDLGRKAIGIELEEKYCEIAAKRLSQQVLAL
jgi:DNA modification methylase